MEKKVYEGYKRTATTNKTAAAKKTTATKTAAPKKTTAPRTRATGKTTAKPAGKSVVQKPRLAMFIDVDNVGISHENLLEVLFYANGKYQIESCNLYGFSDETLPGIRAIANEYNVVTIGKMKFKQSGANCLDSRLLVDAYECALNNKNKIDMIFVWCYPCDLESLFEKIINLGVNTATIDNSIFDCKNKFVSQTFKLYSPYNFSFEQSMYGKVRNEPAQIAPSTNFETATTEEKPATDSVAPKTETATNPAPAEQASASAAPLSPFDDGYVPPVLPRRTIVERSNPNTPKLNSEQKNGNQPENEASAEENNESSKPTSLVEEIARKLNLQIPTEEELAADADESDDDQNAIFMDMLKKAGFGDQPEEKSMKYEDTIGDL